MKKRILSVLLAFAMIFTLMPTALAAPPAYQVVTVDKTTVQAGETVNVKVTLPEGIQTAGSFTVVMDFDKNKFEVTDRKMPPTLTATNTDFEANENVSIVANGKTIANTSGQLTANASYAYNTIQVAGVTVIDATLKAKASGTAAFSFSIFEITYSDNGTKYIVTKDQLETPPSITIPKAPIASVTASVDTPVKGQPLDFNGTVDASAPYSITEVEWFEGTDASGKSVTAPATAKAEQFYYARITLTAKSGETFAESLDNTISGDYSVTRVNDTVLTLTKAYPKTSAATLSGIDIITNPALELAVPTAAPNATATNERSLAVTGVYDDGSGGPVAVNWEITTTPIPKGVSLDGSTLKVTNEAEAGTFRVKATSTEGYTDAETVTITKDASAAKAIVATAPTEGTDIAVPTGGTTTSGNCGYKVYDQYGAEMTGIGATWKMEPATVTGVTLTPANGSISVNNAAKTGTVKLYATSGGLESNKITFNIARAASVATSLTIEGSVDSVTVPTVTNPGITECAYAAYTAKVLDQYGQEMTGQTIAWSVTKNPGVTINNGQLTVTNAATAGSVTITAKSGNLTATKPVTIHKDAAKVSIVRITAQEGETPVTTIICTGSQRLEYYTATVYDQYGKEIQDDVNWSLDPASYSGVNYEISETNNNIVTLKVAPNADAGTFKLVATSKTVPTVKHELNIEVKKKIDVSGKINFNDGSLTYNSEGQEYKAAALDSSVTAGEGGKWTYTYAVKSGSTGTLDAAGLPKTAGTYTVTATYEDSTNVGSKDAVLTIAPKVLHSSDLEQTGGSATKVYDGTATSSITVGVKASSLCGTDTLPINGSAVYNSANVTDANTITFTPAAITTGNYTLAATEKLTITNASITPTTLTVTPNAGQSKEFGATDPTLTYAYSGEVSGETPAFDGELARDPGENVGTYEIKQGTLKLKDNTSFLANNYKLVVASGSKFEITKAASPTLKDITDSQKYTVTSGETAIGTAGMPADAGTLTYAKGTTESTTGTVAIDSWAVDATGKVTYTLSGGAAGDTVTLSVTITSANYNDATVKVVITLTKPSSSGGGGGGGVTTYPITVKSAKNGDVTASHKSATKGATVTLTVDPDKGYVLDTLTVLDGKDKELKLTKKNGKYTFTMPDSKVTVEAMFKASAPTGKNPFVDVPAGSYYEDAVIWAVEQGITKGTSDTMFSPDATCTRAQAVTFLWRAAGSPAAKSGAMPFADVKAGSYYYDAVLWAVEQGITKGTSDTMFSPDATCTRAQIVTFLWRANGSPAVSGNSAFTDVASDAYYAAAVTWAEKNDVTGGIGGGLFGSNNNCTRAQIVTFIYRSVK